MAKRKNIGKKARFEVFKRDSYICQYCGAHPPKAILHVDHIVPVSKGGTNDQDNLVTACSECNLGKSDTPLTVIPESLADKAKRIKEQESQIAGYTEVMREKRERERDHALLVVDIFVEHFGEHAGRSEWASSIMRFNDLLGVYEVMDAMMIAISKKPYSEDNCFKYFCGICWTRIREAERG